MAVAGGPNIVEDGLVLYLDAANPESYPGSGTIWGDLSGNNNNGTLTNGPTFDNRSIEFDGVDDRINIGGVDTYNQYTFEVIMKRTTTPSYDYESFLLNSGESYGAIDRIGISINLRFNWRYRKPDASYATLQSGTNYVQLNEIAILCGTYDGNDVKFYKNGILTNTFSSVSFYDNWGGTFQLGANLTNNAYFNGNIYSFKTYNRALSPTEILQNYNALKSRYGL